MKCKCGASLGKLNRTGKCLKCYQHDYITEKWKNNPEYRLAQKKRAYKWMKEHPEEWKKINYRALEKFYSK